MPDMLDFDEIQHLLLTRHPPLAARYEFLSFSEPVAGRKWLAGLIDKVGTGQVRGLDLPGRQMGEHRVHLERPSRARRR